MSNNQKYNQFNVDFFNGYTNLTYMAGFATIFLKFLVIAIIVISIPAGLIYYDYVSDEVSQNEGVNTSFTININSTAIYGELILGELPRLTEIRMFLNFSQPAFDGTITLYLIEESLYSRFLDGNLPQEAIPTQQIDSDFTTGWFNDTTSNTGIIRLMASMENFNDPVQVEGYYFYDAPSYLSRNSFSLVSFNALYVLIVFGAIPNLIRRYKINKMKRRKQQERIEEEEEFYRNFNQ